MTINRSTVTFYNYTQDFKSQAQTPDMCHMLKYFQRAGLRFLAVFRKSRKNLKNLGHLSEDVTKIWKQGEMKIILALECCQNFKNMVYWQLYPPCHALLF